MLKKWHILVSTILAVSVITVLSISAQESQIPAWVKGVANFWAEGKISDNEFGEAITFLIEQEIIRVQMPNMDGASELKNKITQLESDKASLQNEILQLKEQNSKLQVELATIQKSSSSNVKSAEGFSNMVCKKDALGMVQLTGKYTNGNTAYSFLTISFAILGDSGEVLDTGVAIIQNIDAYQTKIFSAHSTYTGNFKSCEAQVDGGF